MSINGTKQRAMPDFCKIRGVCYRPLRASLVGMGADFKEVRADLALCYHPVRHWWLIGQASRCI